jgi:fumarate hydratase class II
MKTRTEKDTLGEIEVPAARYWGAQTQRSLANFDIGQEIMPLEVIHAYARIKQAAAEANCELGDLPAGKANLISRVCEEIAEGDLDDHFPLSVWQTGSGTQTNMNVNEVIVNRAHVLEGNDLGEGIPALSANDDVNRSQSSNDTFPTAMHVAAYTHLETRTLPALDALAAGLQARADAFDGIVKTGRTHFMDATPITLGQEFSGYAAQLEQGAVQLRAAMLSLLPLALGGTAVGTGLNAPAGFGALAISKIAAATGFAFSEADNRFAALAAHDALVEVHGALNRVAVALAKIANDIRMLGSGPRAGIGEIKLPANEPGSSIMPGKINPTQCEAMVMVCTRVMGNDTTMTVAGSGGQFELNTCKPVMIYTLLQSARLLGDACDAFRRNCVTGIEPNPERIQQHLAGSLMLVTALNPHIGYYKAAEIAQKAFADGISLREAAIASGHVSAEDFDAWVDPARMTGPDN